MYIGVICGVVEGHEEVDECKSKSPGRGISSDHPLFPRYSGKGTCDKVTHARSGFLKILLSNPSAPSCLKGRLLGDVSIGIWGCPKIRGTILGVPIIRTIVY